MERGSNNNYFWFQTFDTDFTLSRFLKELKHYLVDKYIYVSAFDSGKLHLSEEEKQLGWQYLDDVTTSPSIKMDTNIPTAGFDEWYVFTKPPSAIHLSNVYVNYSSFNLSDVSALTKHFWHDIELNQPSIYISEGTSLIVVTAIPALKQDIEKNW